MAERLHGKEEVGSSILPLGSEINFVPMKKNSKTLLIILTLLALLVLAAAVYYFAIWKNKDNQEASSQEQSRQENTGDNQQASGENQENRFEKPTITSAQDSIDYAQAHLAELSPVKPVLGGSWRVTRFWFATDNDFYVEYEDGHILREILVHFNPQTGYGVVGYFEPGENAFELKSGKDTMFGRALILYEYNQATKKWERKN